MGFVGYHGEFNLPAVEFMNEFDNSGIDLRSRVPVAVIIRNKSGNAGLDSVVMAMLFRKSAGYQLSGSVSHQPGISGVGVGGITILGQCPVGSVGDILQGVQQSPIQVENYGFAIHDVFVYILCWQVWVPSTGLYIDGVFSLGVLQLSISGIHNKWGANCIMNNSRLVYSTEKGRVCPNCGNPIAKCRCKKGKASVGKPTPVDGVLRIRREVKGRKGKAVTTITGFDLTERELKEMAARLKRRCGTGGSVKEGVIIIQGDHRNTLLDALSGQGFKAKLSGG